MGAWGTGFRQNDTALDVKSDFAKFDPDVTFLEELTADKLKATPYLLDQRINLHIEYEAQAKKYKKIGKCIELSERTDISKIYEYNIISDLIPEILIEDHFYFVEGYRFGVGVVKNH
ncbi:MAG: hypothetical protein IJ446_08485 [Oscillospiraceae bacterium]|nr:hypothetical protein [Oscillospiraceae bacterium]